MIILALDQSSSVTGWAVFNEGDLIEYGKFDSKGDVMNFKNKFVGLLSDFTPDLVVYEGIYNKQNMGTFKKLAQIQGVILGLAREVLEVYPSEWKSTQGIGGAKRDAQKNNAKKRVERIYNIKATTDVVEAILIGAHAVIKGVNQFEKYTSKQDF